LQAGAVSCPFAVTPASIHGLLQLMTSIGVVICRIGVWGMDFLKKPLCGYADDAMMT
jgi:hypothetical protein